MKLSMFIFISTSTGSIKKYTTYWMSNKKQILRITAANMIVTLFGEVIIRQLFSYLTIFPPSEAFWIDAVGINLQSYVNLTITLFASLFGSVSFFFSRQGNRYLFFVCFSAILSITAQLLLSCIFFIPSIIMIKRLLFDVGYSATLKYLSFELMRKPMKNNRTHLGILCLIREVQDLIMTAIKISLLVLFGI